MIHTMTTSLALFSQAYGQTINPSEIGLLANVNALEMSIIIISHSSIYTHFVYVIF
jgi:hypothetical protein